MIEITLLLCGLLFSATPAHGIIDFEHQPFINDFLALQTVETISYQRDYTKRHKVEIADVYAQYEGDSVKDYCTSSAVSDFSSLEEGRFFALGSLRGLLALSLLHAYSSEAYENIFGLLECMVQYAEAALGFQTFSDMASYHLFLDTYLDSIFIYDLLQYLSPEELDAVFEYVASVVNRDASNQFMLRAIQEIGLEGIQGEFQALYESRRFVDRFRAWRYRRRGTLEQNQSYLQASINHIIESVETDKYYAAYVPYRELHPHLWQENQSVQVYIYTAESQLRTSYSRRNRALLILYACAIYRHQEQHGRFPADIQEINVKELFEDFRGEVPHTNSLTSGLPLTYQVDGAYFTLLGGPEYRSLRGSAGNPTGETFYNSCG